MEWLTNLLGFANNGTSPFGALSGSSSLTPPGGGTDPLSMTPATPAAPLQAAGGGMQLPGIWGKMFGQNAQTGAQTGATGQPGGGLSSGQNFALGQAFNLMKPAQIQPPPMMNLLSGPRG